MTKPKSNQGRRGQIMILSVLLISAAVLGAATVAGMLVIFQLKRTAGAEDSARAIFAADAGIEHALYAVFTSEPNCLTATSTPAQDFSDTITDDESGVSVDYRVVIEENCESGTSVGESRLSHRAFSISMGGLCRFGEQVDPLLCPDE